MFRRLLLVLALTSTVACSMPVAAGDLVQLDVVDRDNGQVLPEYRHRGQDWIAGVPGHRYSVRLTNTTGERVLVVLSVDGVNAVTGQTASPSQGGYVLEPWESAEIAGWRKSLDDIAQFVFTDLPDSYAARTGRPANVGVVGVAVFRERQLRPVYAPPPAPPIAGGMARNEARKAAAPAASADRAMASEARRCRNAWAPAMASASGHRSGRPSSCVRPAARSRSASCATTMPMRWSRWGSRRATGCRMRAPRRARSRVASCRTPRTGIEPTAARTTKAGLRRPSVFRDAVYFFAASSTFSPTFCTSLPAPATVLQPASTTMHSSIAAPNLPILIMTASASGL